MLVNSEIIKDDDKGNKVCLTEKHFTLAARQGRGKENSASVYFFIAALSFVTD